jgi:phage putative head morphogenesis protein, SPP1 gp7 family
MKNSEYWQKRFELLEEATNKSAEATYREIEQSIIRSQREVEENIRRWYQRFADNNEISLADARKLLTNKELVELKWDIKDYIKYGEENSLNQKWIKELENASARVHISRYESLQLQMQQSLEKLYGNQIDSVDTLLKNTYKDNYHHTAFEIQKGWNVGWDMPSIDENKLSKIISKPWTPDGQNFSDRIWVRKREMISDLHQRLTQTMIQGKAPNDLIDYIANKYGTRDKNGKLTGARHAASRLVKTESAFFSSVAQKDAFKELGVDEYEIVATLDSDTSPICQAMDGQVFKMSEYEVGTTAPPLHVFCRSTTAPSFADNFGERAARDENGKTYYVPSDMKYSEWKKSFVNGSTEGLSISSKDSIIKNGWGGLNYQPLPSKNDAIQRLMAGYGIVFKDSEKYPMDGDLLADCVGWMDSFNNQYPEFVEQDPCKLPLIKNMEPAEMRNSIGIYSYYGNKPVSVEIGLNGYYHSNITMFQEYVDKTIEKGWSVANATIHETFVHEFGHHVSHSMRWISKDPYWEKKFIDECISDFKLVEPDYTFNTYVKMGDYVSQYAATSESELFAESFAEYFGNENPRTFAKIFGEKLDKILKGVT